MRTKYKYVEFKRVNDLREYLCVTLGGTVIGDVYMYGPWRQFCFFPVGNTVYSADCLQNIAHFLEQSNGEEKGR